MTRIKGFTARGLQPKRRTRANTFKNTRRIHQNKGEFAIPLSRLKSHPKSSYPLSAKSARISTEINHSSSNLWSTRAQSKPANIDFDRLDIESIAHEGGKITLPFSKYERMLQAIQQLQSQVHDLELENKKLRMQAKARERTHSPVSSSVQGFSLSKTSRNNKKRHTQTGRRPNTRERPIELQKSPSSSLLVDNDKSPDASYEATGRSDSEEWEESSTDNDTSPIDYNPMTQRSGFKLDLSRINLKGAKAMADISDLNSDPSASFEITDSGTYRQGMFALNKHGIRVVADCRKQGGFKTRTGMSSDDLVLLRVLGRGSSAVVYKCYHTKKQTFVALKAINIFEQEKRRQLAKELNTFTSSLKNHFLIDFYGAYFEEGSISLVLEYMDNGSLQDLIERTGRGVPEHLNANISRQVLEGLKFLHLNHMIHRDLKPANILLDTKGQCKITDFGILANVNDTKKSHELSECKTFIGTLYYMSPERLEGKPYSYGSDVWAFGLTILACAIGKHPITSKDHLDLMSKFRCLPDLIASEVSMTNISLKFSDFLTRCIDMDPLNRPSSDKLLKHAFISGSRANTLEEAAEILSRSPHWVQDKIEDRSLEEDLVRICDTYATKVERTLPAMEMQKLSRLFSADTKRITTIFQKCKARRMLSES
eukprot:CAMPEP_0197536266 /NCGR_PEP_ID=MMETSP1318-20131121/53439_1 /TAXON_ID=552666 /ORGANISM="Partenskyella glossopodia, Strain RCC365" /LENGTH=653 /DNA_ID=CAMNT_0043094111 /DNA_START=260 /DNA_END=2221 /DNA_ORIENTATION=+